MPGPRYLLEDRVAEGDLWTLWCGADDVLKRPVGVLIVAAEHPHREAVAEAAVRAGAVRHPGSVHVYDVAGIDDGATQIVREWVEARTLVDRLADGVLDEVEACRIGASVARVLGEAHRSGVTHRHLRPEDVLLSEDGRVRLIGIAVSAALEGEPIDADEEHRAADARDCAAITYAAVTGRWPGRSGQTDLPPAPRSGDRPVRARQVRAGVPTALDNALARMLDQATDADDTAAELEELEARLSESHPTAQIAGLGGLLAADATADDDAPQPGPSKAGRVVSRALAVGLSLLILALAAVTATVLLRDDRKAPAAASESTGRSSASKSASTSRTPSTAQPVGPIVIKGAQDFDPQGDGSEKPDEVPNAIDGDLSTAWHTLLYKQQDLAPKHGVGLVLDLGSVQSIGAIRVDLVGTGTTVQLRSAATLGSQPADYSLIGSAADAGALVTVRAKAPVKARYVLVWLTRLPPTGGGYRGGVAEVTVLRA